MGKGLRLVSSMWGVALAAALLTSPASGATLVGDYQFQGTTASAGAGPVLTGLGDPSSFQTDTVMGVSRQVLVFPEGSGLQMSPAGVGAGPYSAVTTFRFDTLSGWRRVLDPFNSTTESGLYSHDGRLNVYGNDSGESASVLLSPNTYGTVAMVMAGLPVGVKAYFNGAPVAQLAESFNLVNDTLRFFKDDGGLSGFEESAGAVSCIRVFSGALTDAEVAAIGASPRCAAPAPAPSAKKKCKKKKKHRAAEAKKKKCKKKKK